MRANCSLFCSYFVQNDQKGDKPLGMGKDSPLRVVNPCRLKLDLAPKVPVKIYLNPTKTPQKQAFYVGMAYMPSHWCQVKPKVLM